MDKIAHASAYAGDKEGEKRKKTYDTYLDR